MAKFDPKKWVKQHRKRQAVLVKWIEQKKITEGLSEVLDDLDNNVRRSQLAFTNIEKSAVSLQQSAKEVRRKIEFKLSNNLDQPPMIKLSLVNRDVDQATQKMLAKYYKSYDEAINALQYNLAVGYGITFTVPQIVAMSELASPALDQIKFESALMKADVKALLLKNLGQGLSVPDIVKGLRHLYPGYESHIYTLTNTSLLNTYKDAHFTKLEENFNYFKYVGPNDSVTRPYCKAHVGKIYTKAEAREIHTTMLTLYNCRHTLEPVRDTDAGIKI